MPRPIPTVGRKVWYFPSAAASEPQDATIIKVTKVAENAPEDALCNLFVVSPFGQTSLVTDVQACDDDNPSDYQHFRWMPYQVKQVEAQVLQSNLVPPATQKL